jgi:hypothetical protein
MNQTFYLLVKAFSDPTQQLIILWEVGGRINQVILKSSELSIYLISSPMHLGSWGHAFHQLWDQSSVSTVIFRGWSSLLLKLLRRSPSNSFPLHDFSCGRMSSGSLSHDCYLFSGPQSRSVSNNKPLSKWFLDIALYNIRSNKISFFSNASLNKTQERSVSHQISILSLWL